MLAYPGYTVRRIEGELSWREVGALMARWHDEPPTFLTDRKVQKILQAGLGVKLTEKKMANESLVQRLEGMGWL
jgi:hypothetical protein